MNIKITKNKISLLLAIATLGSIAGCGSSDDSTNDVPIPSVNLINCASCSSKWIGVFFTTGSCNAAMVTGSTFTVKTPYQFPGSGTSSVALPPSGSHWYTAGNANTITFAPQSYTVCAILTNYSGADGSLASYNSGSYASTTIDVSHGSVSSLNLDMTTLTTLP